MSRSREDELVALVPELLPFNKDGAPVFNWLSALGDVTAALIYARLFWPDFRSEYGCIFLRPVDRAVYEKWMTTLKQDARMVERTLNHTHLSDLFANSESPVTVDRLLSLGRVLEEAWTYKLKLDFPERSFLVILEGKESLDPVDVTITFGEIAG
jgi:hypothetical protein